MPDDNVEHVGKPLLVTFAPTEPPNLLFWTLKSSHLAGSRARCSFIGVLPRLHKSEAC